MEKIYDALIAAHRLLWSNICFWLIDNLSTLDPSFKACPNMEVIYGDIKEWTYDWIIKKHEILQDSRIVHDYENSCFLCDYARTKMEYADNDDDSKKVLRFCAFCPSVYSKNASPKDCLSDLYRSFYKLTFNYSDDMRETGIEIAARIRDTPIKSDFKPAGIDLSYSYDEALKQIVDGS